NFSRKRDPDTISLTVLCTVTCSIEDLPEVTGAAIVNGVQIVYFDSDIWWCVPRQQFMAKYLDKKFWDCVTDLALSHLDRAKEYLNNIKKMSNQTSGIHIFQLIMIVNVTEDGSIKRSMQFGYNGKDYISLEPDRMRWETTNHLAVWVKEKWNSDESWNDYWKRRLEESFANYLLLHFQTGKECFLRKVQPEVFISRSDPNSQYKPLTLSCLVTGFYPVDIEVSWLRNGEVMSETLSLGVRPNHDGTHQIQKEIEINAGDEDQYSCQIEHSSLAETQLYQWEIPENSIETSHLGMIIGLVTAPAALLLLIGIIIWKRQERDSPSMTYTTAQSK
ncbi:class I histocompatibility antigen, F10 alpha chain-like, partial [Carcharodon carcharias]|uniref:class I histocompatibility antigen, F10 alpha chain-like n=1 Tax=Carcharodon carcharias TaxID=13397 RepID=UPI001B7E088E